MARIKKAQDAERAAGGGGGELVLGNLDDPIAAADRDAGQRGGIFRLQPALRRGDVSCVDRQGGNGNSRGGSHGRSGARNKSGRENVHGGDGPFVTEKRLT